MSVKDKHGVEITIDSYIIYTNTGTIGKVLDTKTDENGSWVLIQVAELNKLWYNTKYVELTDKQYAKKITKDDEDDENLSVKDIKNKISNQISSEMSGEAVGGG